MNQLPSPSEQTSPRHFAGSMTLYLVRYLQNHCAPGTLDAALSISGENRDPEVLCHDATWSSYGQFRSLLEAAGQLIGGPEKLFAAGASAWDTLSTPEITGTLQSLGSPGALYADISLAAAALSTVIVADSNEVGTNEWILGSRFRPGFAPFPEFCSFAAGLFSITPRMFGFPAAEVVEFECQRDGAPACRYRVRWQDNEEVVRRAEYYETRAQILEARIEALQRTVDDLVSGERLEEVLSRIVASAARAVLAPWFVLAIDALPSAARQVYAAGLDEAEALPIAKELLAGERIESGRLVVEVVSNRRSYGRLAALRPDSEQFFPQELVTLGAYARLAAAALDSATVLEEARLQATTARVLLELSESLAGIGSTDEVAARVARAVPGLIDCDRAVVTLFDASTSTARIAGCYGYSFLAERLMRQRPIHAVAGDETGVPVYVERGGQHERSLSDDFMSDTGSVAAITVSIVVSTGLIGWVTATVTERAQRLLAPDVKERLRGLAGQAAIAISNASRLDQIRHQALHDPLTGLPNRALILDRVEQMLTRSRRKRTAAAALFIDLDGFKDVNDTLGHAAGDHLLQAVTARLAATLRESDTIGRLGGDEFVVLLEGPSLDDGAEVVADRLLDLLRKPFTLEADHVPLAVTASIGIAVGDRHSPGELLRDADIALYAAKAAGKNCHVVFQPEMQTALRDRLDLEMDLRGALSGGQFLLVYQPIINLLSTEVTGVEALLRWRHPTRGLVQPTDFIPPLEDTGMIIDVGRWVLNEACRQTAVWHAKGHSLAMSVNVSARQLDTDGFVSDVENALITHRLDPASLIIEITETTIMRDAEATARRLEAIKATGVRVAIDDFGTGYSSLAYLSQFPVDSLKIDRSFVSAIATSAEAAALIHTLVQLGKSLGMETVAEGIEELAEFAHLQREQCDSGQGFLISGPLEVAALEDFLADPHTVRLALAVLPLAAGTSR